MPMLITPYRMKENKDTLWIYLQNIVKRLADTNERKNLTYKSRLTYKSKFTNEKNLLNTNRTQKNNI